MSVLTLVQPGRWLDSIIFAFMLLFLSGASLYGFGLAHSFLMAEVGGKGAGKSNNQLAGMIPPQVPVFVERILPMPGKKWTFSLTHVLLMSILISLLSMAHHPAQDRIEENAMLQKKKKEKRDGEKTD